MRSTALPALGVLAGAALVVAGGCDGTLSPLRGHAVVGRDAYAIFVADGPGGAPDLFAVRGDGGPVFPVTFTPVGEMRPALSPDGVLVAFLRTRTLRDSLPGAVWVMHLLTGAERELRLPSNAARPEQVAWSRDGQAVYIRAGREVYRAAVAPDAPPPAQVPPTERAAADSSFEVWLGDPPFARVVPCGNALCAQHDTAAPIPFAPGARDPIRWGPDSVAYLIGQRLVVRPVGPGRERDVGWENVPDRPREGTYFSAGRRGSSREA